jgi:hypothetical protein
LFFFPFFAFWPFLIPFLIIFFVLRIGPRLFRGLFRDLEDRREYSARMPFPQKQRRIRKSNDTESIIFSLAYRLKGRITLSDIIIETGLSMKEAETVINQMLDGIRVRMEVDESGMMVYEFPEIIARFKGGSDL